MMNNFYLCGGGALDVNTLHWSVEKKDHHDYKY